MTYLAQSADLSPDGVYRYTLRRQWAVPAIVHAGRRILFVGLNPSTADATQDDPTIRREVRFARAWGFDHYLKANLYAYRATDPKDLWAAARRGVDIAGPVNVATVYTLAHEAEIVAVAWGAARLDAGGRLLARWLLALPHARCLGHTADGSPKHPLYLKKTTALERV